VSEFNELYQELILDHHKRPRNYKRLGTEECTCHADGRNPLCGDTLALDVKVEGDRIADIGFDGSGCAISTASASIMTESVKGKTKAEVKHLFDVFHGMVTEQKMPEDMDSIGKLAVFSAVGEYPARVKCATLSWHTLMAALSGNKSELVTTE
jgi:nitrogen fixation protein NifU and related proteins